MFPGRPFAWSASTVNVAAYLPKFEIWLHVILVKVFTEDFREFFDFLFFLLLEFGTLLHKVALLLVLVGLLAATTLLEHL